MVDVVVVPYADQDVQDIIDYLQSEAETGVAGRYLDNFEALLDRLATYPETGTRRPQLGAKARIGISHPYIIVYDYVPDQDVVVVLRVLHGHRKITKRLLTKPRQSYQP